MINKDFFLALEDLEREKGIRQETFIETLESALVFAYKKNFGSASGISVKLNPEKNTIKVYGIKTVVEEITDPDREITLEEAREIKKTAKVGDVLTEEITPKDFGRIAAQTAKQVIMQRLKEIERDVAVEEFTEKENEVLTCIVRRIEGTNVFVDIGKGQIEGILMAGDQINGEHYEVNDKFKVYVKKVRTTAKGPQIVVSRTSAGLVKRLFENEVPEIRQGLVVIKSIARDAGQRTKMAVFTEESGIDPVERASETRACASMRSFPSWAERKSILFPGAKIRSSLLRGRFRRQRSFWCRRTARKRAQRSLYPTTSFRLRSARTDKMRDLPHGSRAGRSM